MLNWRTINSDCVSPTVTPLLDISNCDIDIHNFSSRCKVGFSLELHYYNGNLNMVFLTEYRNLV